MRWLPFIILAYVLLLLQTTLVQVVAIPVSSIGTLVPDLLAVAAVFVALNAKNGLDAMLAAWILGLAADLTTGAAHAMPAVGPMPIAYALSAGAIVRVREVLFREWVSTKIVLGLLFCLMAHEMWVTAQTLLAWGLMSWGDYGRLVLQALGISVYTAAVTAPLCWLLSRVQGLLLTSPGSRNRRF